MKRAAVDHNPESGFAVLFIYAMAATVAIMLFMALPRVAFEAQRDKEQLLIDRGEQYSRAVTLFVRKFNRFPADIDALQNTQNLRFLRQKYIDPMTGKDDWRIVHVGTGGVFTDSLVNNNKAAAQQFAQQNFITEMQQTGGTQTGATQGVNIGTRQRPSDQPGVPGDPNQTLQPALPQAQLGLAQPGAPQPGFPQIQFDANGQPIPNSPNPGNAPFPNQVSPAAGVFPGQQPAQPFGQQPAQPFGQTQNGAPLSAGSLINQILTTPRPGGLNGLGGAQQPTVDQYGNPIQNIGAPANTANAIFTGANSTTPPATTPGAAAQQVIGGGMAGVASKYEQEGIKVYKEQTSYNKWEFVYDITKDPARGGGAIPQAVPPANGTTAMPNSFAPQNNIPPPTLPMLLQPGPNGAPPAPPPAQMPITQ